MHIPEIKRLHEEAFPTSALRASWLAFVYGSAVVVGVSVILAIK